MNELPKSSAAQVLVRQVLRSGTSIGANYREASRGRSKAEFIAKVGDCLAYWPELLRDSRLISIERIGSLLNECEQLVAIPVTISKRAKDNSGP